MPNPMNLNPSDISIKAKRAYIFVRGGKDLVVMLKIVLVIEPTHSTRHRNPQQAARVINIRDPGKNNSIFLL